MEAIFVVEKQSDAMEHVVEVPVPIYQEEQLAVQMKLVMAQGIVKDGLDQIAPIAPSAQVV